MTRPIHIALLWHTVGHGNLGVDALARSNAAILRAAAERSERVVQFTTLGSGQPQSIEALPEDVTVGPMPRIKPLLKLQSDYLAVLRRSDLAVDIGEGDSWTDIYGPRRFAFHFGTKVAALALRKPLVLAPQTIGPFASTVRRRMAFAVMNGARAVFTRDSLSTGYLRTHGLRAETAEYMDVAFRLPFTARSRGAGDRVQVGLNVSGLLYNGGYTGANELGVTLDYPDYSRRLIEALLAQGADIHLIAHVTAEGGNDDDRSVLPELVARYPALKIAPEFRSASSAKSFMSGMDFVVAGRMHACIGAFSAGVPVVPVAYSRKFNGLFDTLRYPHYVDGKAMDTQAALAATLRAFAERTRLEADITHGLEIARDRLAAYEDRMAMLIAGLRA
ncbi:polysaccharide pyruvyl transferase family protein [Tsuneonella sp. SYSU-LHT278]|uniref:polysaccharide pyruvyl transferase family protein n=1 Tax=Tsuneonella sediminis TaxID=3416089 RepID=UPI003F78F009